MIKGRSSPGSDRSARRWLGLALLATVLAALMWAAVAGQGAPTGRVVEVEPGELRLLVAAEGELQSAQSTQIVAPSNPCTWEVTISFMAAEGEHLAAGDPVVAFDTQELDKRAERQQNDLAAAEKELEKARLDEQGELDKLVLDEARFRMEESKSQQKIDIPAHLQSDIEAQRNRLDWELARDGRQLAEQRVASQRETLTARVAELTSRVERLASQLAVTERCIEAFRIAAPRPGLVVHRSNWDGKKFAVGTQTWAGRVIVELPDLGRMQVLAEVAEPDAGKVAVGQQAEVRLDAEPDRVFRGRVESLGRIFRPRSNEDPSVVFDVVIALDDPDPELMRPGMAARVELVVDRLEHVITVPEEAVVYTSEGPAVPVVRAFGGVRQTPVSLGHGSGGRVVVLDGLRAGDRILVAEGGPP